MNLVNLDGIQLTWREAVNGVAPALGKLDQTSLVLLLGHVSAL